MLSLGLLDRSGLHRTDQPVTPGPGGFGEQCLDAGLVLPRDVDVMRARSAWEPYREMHYGPRRFTDARGVLDADAAQLADQDVLHLKPDGSGVPVARQVH